MEFHHNHAAKLFNNIIVAKFLIHYNRSHHHSSSCQKLQLVTAGMMNLQQRNVKANPRK